MTHPNLPEMLVSPVFAMAENMICSSTGFKVRGGRKEGVFRCNGVEMRLATRGFTNFWANQADASTYDALEADSEGKRYELREKSNIYSIEGIEDRLDESHLKFCHSSHISSRLVLFSTWNHLLIHSSQAFQLSVIEPTNLIKLTLITLFMALFVRVVTVLRLFSLRQPHHLLPQHSHIRLFHSHSPRVSLQRMSLSWRSPAFEIFPVLRHPILNPLKISARRVLVHLVF
jgi:hypothetical protein